MSNNESEYQEIAYQALPKGYGYIYHILNCKNELIYIGQTKNIYERIGSHLKTISGIQKIRYFTFPIEELSNIVADQIIKFDPILNSTNPANDFWCSLESYKKNYTILIGKHSKIRKIMQKNNLKFFKGTYLHKDSINLIIKELEGI